MEFMGKIGKKRGITLISLIVTIIILLILAGVTLNLVLGEEGIIFRDEKAVNINNLAQIEEQANIIYADLLLKSYASQGGYSEPTLDEVLSQLKSSKYIEDYRNTINSSSVTGITLDKSSFSVAKGGKVTINVSYEGEQELSEESFIVIQGKNYLIQKQSNKIAIEKDITEINELYIDTSDENVVTASANKNTITLTASSTKTGNSTITVSYGDKSATCAVTVVDGSFSTAYGRIEVIWLNGTTNMQTNTPNAPRLAGMTPITWAENADYSASDTPTPATAQQIANKSWYSYNAISGTDDNRTSHWANAQNSDGSYFVWIPRYAYRITYYSSSTSTEPTGYYDGNGMYKADGTVRYSLDEGIETVDYNGNKYIVHPAFETDLDNGGWDNELEGFWVAKYEMSKYDSAYLSVPNVSSARSITIGDTYTYSKNYDTSKESHLIKNSEWGAVAYLTHSQFGRNGNEIDINNSSSYITGNGGGSTNAMLGFGINNAYNTANGTKASTTGNIYGVYDISGGAWELTAAFDTKSEHDNMNNGSSFAATGGTSTKYATAYSNGSETYSGTKVYEVGKVGDATKEVYVGSGDSGWFRDYSYFAGYEKPFFRRGGYYRHTRFAGVFYVAYAVGDVLDMDNGFRVVLCP